MDICAGMKFGRWTIVEASNGKRDALNRLRWVCCCECGNPNHWTLSEGQLQHGYIKSCGECMKYARRTHGQSKTRLYRCWSAMVDRSRRGISICDEWLIFANFSEWAKENGYREVGSSVRRINKQGGFHPENCRVARMYQDYA